MEHDYIKQLIRKYNNQTATAEEKLLVEDWYARIEGEDLSSAEADLDAIKSEIYTTVISRISQQHSAPNKQQPVKKLFPLFARVAALLIIALGGFYLYFHKPIHPFIKPNTNQAAQHQIKPGGNNAILKLGNGQEIILNESAEGQLALQDGVLITKTSSGEVTYHFANQQSTAGIKNNTISTPKGGQYHLILTDGTQVWLNASSSITFPTAFTGTKRNVAITGEAYFEVAKDKLKPFMVHTDQSVITVLGTHFNVNTYSDEDDERTTLLEGAVAVKNNTKTELLHPGEQATIARSSPNIKVKTMENPDAAIAWKQGYFQFSGSDLRSFMRQISRWYDTEVIYNGEIPVKSYTGKIPRNSSAEELIRMLSYSGIHCRIEQGRITINPK
ncbi:FecR family protein [Pedobacter frigidisoli]|uniref:FecR family protein n=1 Tax=Pedobacter frigidisoli TaxID=2530455 RepID=UPI002930C2D9|nr:FecR domain-containing protein [Pedobacter frigidisoli]